MDKYIRIVKEAIQQAKENGKKYYRTTIPSPHFFKNYEAQQEIEQEFCDYTFVWLDDYYNKKSWVTHILVKW